MSCAKNQAPQGSHIIIDNHAIKGLPIGCRQISDTTGIYHGSMPIQDNAVGRTCRVARLGGCIQDGTYRGQFVHIPKGNGVYAGCHLGPECLDGSFRRVGGAAPSGLYCGAYLRMNYRCVKFGEAGSILFVPFLPSLVAIIRHWYPKTRRRLDLDAIFARTKEVGVGEHVPRPTLPSSLLSTTRPS